jgi:hypothetical protein
MSGIQTTPRKLWQHADPEGTAMWKFMQRANQKRGLNMQVRFLSFLIISTKSVFISASDVQVYSYTVFPS